MSQCKKQAWFSLSKTPVDFSVWCFDIMRLMLNKWVHDSQYKRFKSSIRFIYPDGTVLWPEDKTKLFLNEPIPYIKSFSHSLHISLRTEFLWHQNLTDTTRTVFLLKNHHVISNPSAVILSKNTFLKWMLICIK